MPYQPKRCRECGAEFTPHGPKQVFCEEHLPRKERSRAFRSKVCRECGVEFTPTTIGQAHCAEHSGPRGWERRNKEVHLANRRLYMRRRRHLRDYGDADIYERLVDVGGERCAICGHVPEPGHYLRVDHCHARTTIRGLLCGSCNVGLGYFKDEPERLRAAAAYLDR